MNSGSMEGLALNNSHSMLPFEFTTQIFIRMTFGVSESQRVSSLVLQHLGGKFLSKSFDNIDTRVFEELGCSCELPYNHVSPSTPLF